MKTHQLILAATLLFFGSTLLTSAPPLDATQKTQEELNALLKKAVNGNKVPPPNHIEALFRAGANPFTCTRKDSPLLISAIKKRRGEVVKKFTQEIINRNEEKKGLRVITKQSKKLKEEIKKKRSRYIKSQIKAIQKITLELKTSLETRKIESTTTIPTLSRKRKRTPHKTTTRKNKKPVQQQEKTTAFKKEINDQTIRTMVPFAKYHHTIPSNPYNRMTPSPKFAERPPSPPLGFMIMFGDTKFESLLACQPRKNISS